MLHRLKAILEKLKWSHVIFLVGGGAAFFYFMQDNSEIESKEQGIQTEQQSITSLERKIQEAKEFEKQFEDKKRHYSELVKSLQNLKEALPRQFFLPDLLSDVLREAQQLEIEITMIRPDQREDQGELYNSLGFNVDAKGSFLQFFIFMDRLAHMSRLLNVENFTINRDQARPSITMGGDQGMFAGSHLTGGMQPQTGVSVSFRVITYRYKGGSGGAEASPQSSASGANGDTSAPGAPTGPGRHGGRK
jgi:Tfp pilus assembly protein PilO